jgi:hypothetical protein
LPVLELLLAPLAAIATTPPGGVLKLKFSSASNDTMNTVWRAVRQKYFRAPDCRKPKNAREVARSLAIAVLANKKWNPFDREIAALLVDQNFVERLALGLERKRKPIFDEDECFFLLNWHEWSDKRLDAFKKQNVPPLKFWTREAICNLMEGYDEKVFGFARLDSRLRRIALDKQSVKPAKITSYVNRDGVHRMGP